MKKYLSTLTGCALLFCSVGCFANPGDVTIYNAANNNGAVNFYFVVNGASTAYTGGVNPNDHRTLTHTAFGDQKGNLYIHMCNLHMVSDNCQNPSDWKALPKPVVYSYDPTQAAIALTCWYDSNHVPGCSAPE